MAQSCRAAYLCAVSALALVCFSQLCSTQDQTSYARCWLTGVQIDVATKHSTNSYRVSDPQKTGACRQPVKGAQGCLPDAQVEGAVLDADVSPEEAAAQSCTREPSTMAGKSRHSLRAAMLPMATSAHTKMHWCYFLGCDWSSQVRCTSFMEPPGLDPGTWKLEDGNIKNHKKIGWTLSPSKILGCCLLC